MKKTRLHKLRFVSQKKNIHKRFGCGAASLMMLLRHHKLPTNTPTYKDLCRCLWLDVDPAIKGETSGCGAYPPDIERALQGMQSRGGDHIIYSKTESKAQSAARWIQNALEFCGPVMCAMKGTGFGGVDGHWIVIFGNEEKKFQYFDPDEPKMKTKDMDMSKFKKHWDGYGLVLAHQCRCS